MLRPQTVQQLQCTYKTRVVNSGFMSTVKCDSFVLQVFEQCYTITSPREGSLREKGRNRNSVPVSITRIESTSREYHSFMMPREAVYHELPTIVRVIFSNEVGSTDGVTVQSKCLGVGWGVKGREVGRGGLSCKASKCVFST